MSGNQAWSKVSCVLGAQWGDEGKGKIVDLLSLEMDVVCRYAVSLVKCTAFLVDDDNGPLYCSLGWQQRWPHCGRGQCRVRLSSLAQWHHQRESVFGDGKWYVA